MQVLRKLYVFGGQRKREDPMNDFFSISVDTDEVEIISATARATDALVGASSSVVSCSPCGGHTQRATIDVERNEIHVMTVIFYHPC